MAKAAFRPRFQTPKIAEIVAAEKFMADDLDWRTARRTAITSQRQTACSTRTAHQYLVSPNELQVRRGRYKEDCSYEFCIFLLKAAGVTRSIASMQSHQQALAQRAA
jgi:hypothetical protein